ncbi:uncharacterized mitochondrial protein-like protein, partial [Tanacetum coccineum]
MLGLNVITGMTQAEKEDVAHTLEVVDEVEVKDMVGITRKTKVNVTPRKTMKIMNKRVNNMRNVTSHIYSVTIVINPDTLFQNALNETETMKLTLMRHKRKYTPPKSESNINDEDDVWYFDNGASNHMTCNYSYFSELNENIIGRVRFGDGPCVSIKGKGSILFQGKNGEQKLLKDVYYIPALRSNVISLGQATISDYDISIRGDFLTMRDSWGSLLIKVPHSENCLYKAQLNVGKEGTNEVGRESDEKVNPHSSSVTVHETKTQSEEDESRSDGIPIRIARLETIRLLIALAADKGWKIHHLDVKTAFLNGNRKKLDSTLKELGFLQCVHEKTVYRKVPNGEVISIEVSQGKDYVEIKQERYAMKILKEAGMEDCNATLCPMEPGLKLSKDEDEPEVEATQYRKVVGCLCYLLLTRPDLTYSVGVVSRYITSGHVFYLGTSPITRCSQKQTTVALSSCEAEFMESTSAVCQAIWLRELLAEVTGLERQKVITRVDNKSTIALSKNLVFMEGANISTLDITSSMSVWRMS